MGMLGFGFFPAILGYPYRTFNGTLYYFPHILAEYNTRIDNLHICILRFVPQKMRSIGVSSTKMCFFFGSSWWTIIHTAFHWYCLQNKAVLFGGNKSYYYKLIVFYWLWCCHLTFRKIWYCLIKTRIDLVSLSFSINVIKQLQSFVSVNTSFYGP